MVELITPRSGLGVCPACCNFTQQSRELCRACRANESHLDAIVPISYAPAGGALHRELADYKRTADPSVPLMITELARALSLFVSQHERCVAAASGGEGFDLVTVVPSSEPRRDRGHPLRRIVAHEVAETASRYRAALSASGTRCVPHQFDRRRFRVTEAVAGRRVLLVDDVWTTGANAQSAAAVLRAAGATSVAALVIGRYVNGCWGGIAERLDRLSRDFDPSECVICRGRPPLIVAAPGGQRAKAFAAGPSYTPDSPKGGRSSVG